VIEACLARIKELGLLDDREYARRRAHLMAEKGYGDFAIKVFLEGLGIPEKMAYDAMKGIPEELGERKRMSMIIEKRKDTPKEKLIRFLAGRGFPIDVIMEVIGGVDA
jgi:SOS response regulatory protein OraA/RecX